MNHLGKDSPYDLFGMKPAEVVSLYRFISLVSFMDIITHDEWVNIMMLLDDFRPLY